MGSSNLVNVIADPPEHSLNTVCSNRLASQIVAYYNYSKNK